MIALGEAHDRALYGGKAAGLAAAIRGGLPVPDGIALAWNETPDLAALTALIAEPVVVRSSAVDEDGAAASFAGQHKTIVNVRGAAVQSAIAEVIESATAPSALAYRARLGITTPPRMAVVIQRLVDPTCAGVLFTRHPTTGADERVAEAAWGLGEAVVAGLVTPDAYRWTRGAATCEAVPGIKDLELRPAESGGVEERPVSEPRRSQRVLTEKHRSALELLAVSCEAVFAVAGSSLDIEWAFTGDDVVLLQCRRITR